MAAHALSKLGPDARPAVPRMAELLGEGDGRQRYQVAMALERLGPDARAAVPALAAQVEKGLEPISPHPVLAALGKVGPDAGEAVSEGAVSRRDAVSPVSSPMDRDDGDVEGSLRRPHPESDSLRRRIREIRQKAHARPCRPRLPLRRHPGRYVEQEPARWHRLDREYRVGESKLVTDGIECRLPSRRLDHAIVYEADQVRDPFGGDIFHRRQPPAAVPDVTSI